MPMISKKKIEELAQERLNEIGAFLVDIHIDEYNKILVEIDSDNGVSINDCISVSRNIEHNLDREEEDFELTVTSSGLDKPLKILRQYQKNIGKEIEVTTTDGNKIQGTLKEVSPEHITIEVETKEKVEGKKKKQTITTQHQLSFNNIKQTKLIIKFK
jgi:ribosome maturation factor RimP